MQLSQEANLQMYEQNSGKNERIDDWMWHASGVSNEAPNKCCHLSTQEPIYLFLAQIWNTIGNTTKNYENPFDSDF